MPVVSATGVINDIENRPGVTSKVITPDESIVYWKKQLKICPEITVAGIAGPGDTLASDYALETFRKIKGKISETYQVYEHEWSFAL